MSEVSNCETVLVVEDEATLRLSAVLLLQKQGFSVVAAGDGHSAVNLFQAQSDEIDIVLLDLTLPDVPGAHVFREMRRLKPEIKILLMSAYNQEKVRAHFTLEEQALFQFIHKPYRVTELITRLREVLA